MGIEPTDGGGPGFKSRPGPFVFIPIFTTDVETAVDHPIHIDSALHCHPDRCAASLDMAVRETRYAADYTQWSSDGRNTSSTSGLAGHSGTRLVSVVDGNRMANVDVT